MIKQFKDKISCVIQHNKQSLGIKMLITKFKKTVLLAVILKCLSVKGQENKNWQNACQLFTVDLFISFVEILSLWLSPRKIKTYVTLVTGEEFNLLLQYSIHKYSVIVHIIWCVEAEPLIYNMLMIFQCLISRRLFDMLPGSLTSLPTFFKTHFFLRMLPRIVQTS